MIAVVVQRAKNMATCQDLVDATNGINTTLQSVLAEQQETRATLNDIKDKINDIQLHLGQRLPARAITASFMMKVVEAILTSGDVVAERVAQQVQAELGLSAIAESEIPDVEPLDVSLDTDTVGTTTTG